MNNRGREEERKMSRAGSEIMGWELWDWIKLSELREPAPQTEKDNPSNSEPHPLSRTPELAVTASFSH